MTTPEQEQQDTLDWRKLVDAALEQGRLHMKATDERMGALEDEMVNNTAMTMQVQSNTSEIVEIMNDWKGAMKVIGYVGRAAKPLTYIVGLCSAIYAFWVTVMSGGHR